jgi:hypothetical protein
MWNWKQSTTDIKYNTLYSVFCWLNPQNEFYMTFGLEIYKVRRNKLLYLKFVFSWEIF